MEYIIPSVKEKQAIKSWKDMEKPYIYITKWKKSMRKGYNYTFPTYFQLYISNWKIQNYGHSNSWAPKSLQMVTAAMKLKDTCSLEEKLWPT